MERHNGRRNIKETKTSNNEKNKQCREGERKNEGNRMKMYRMKQYRGRKAAGRKKLNQERGLRQGTMNFSLPEAWEGAVLAQRKCQPAVLRHMEMEAQQSQSLNTSTYGPGS